MPTRPQPTATRQQRKQQTRQALLDAAQRLLRQHGLANLTTREIAAAAGVATGTFFVHFPDMNSLIETILDDRIGAALHDAAANLPPGDDLVAQLVHIAATLFDSYAVEPDLSQQYLSATLFHPSPGGPAEKRIAEFQEWVGRLISKAVSSGAVAPVDTQLAFSTYFSLYFGILVAGLRGQLTRVDQLRVLERALRRFFHREDTEQ